MGLDWAAIQKNEKKKKKIDYQIYIYKILKLKNINQIKIKI